VTDSFAAGVIGDLMLGVIGAALLGRHRLDFNADTSVGDFDRFHMPA